MIKDSGDRTEFETGAVRDMHEGKGRCDLLPLDVIGELFDGVNQFQSVLQRIEQFKCHDGDVVYLKCSLDAFCEQLNDYLKGGAE